MVVCIVCCVCLYWFDDVCLGVCAFVCECVSVFIRLFMLSCACLFVVFVDVRVCLLFACCGSVFVVWFCFVGCVMLLFVWLCVCVYVC